ncbi:imidazole glycerol phosphate synthase subunit HisH [Pseudodesulfovibrio sp. F-1]|uniref:Imidazole glycerol phosphate synthase subunit HisH n=1 Tax=Pseudodesulfovibrio alkaliphilus TaxID=2661613 RepID=A0A7K1KLK1_9BACT|nr:imidazole glycerol phosphate synthase subunit HisH [Pseudodesulfovibrio alkaliphilus]
MSVAVVNYGVGNIDSLSRALTVCGAKPLLTDREKDFKVVDACVLPGVGAFGDAIKLLRARHLDTILEDQIIAYDIPILGVCLGMQLLASRSFELGEHEGLGWIPGTVKPLKPTAKERIPHVGWNSVEHDGSDPLFDGIPSGEDFYFVHGYHFDVDSPSNILGKTSYCGKFTSAVRHKNIFGTQFHPEKSQGIGLRLLRNFIHYCEKF